MTARYPELCRFVAVGSTVHPSHKAVAVSLEVRSPSDRRAVTLRRCSDDHQETWLIHYGDVRVGSIATRADVPVDANRWGWSCGIYPNAQDGRTLIDLSGFDCKNDAAAIDKASLLAVGVSLDKPQVDPKRHIAIRNDAGQQVSTVPVYSTPSEEHPAK
jgi:hypothetical protein